MPHLMLAAADGNGPKRLTKLLEMLPKTVVDGDDTLKRKADAVSKPLQNSKMPCRILVHPARLFNGSVSASASQRSGDESMHGSASK